MMRIDMSRRCLTGLLVAALLLVGHPSFASPRALPSSQAASPVGGVATPPTTPTAEARPGTLPPLAALFAQAGPPGATPPASRPSSVTADDPPRAAPLPREDRRAEEAAAERRRREELAELPAYKRWWFWALTAVVVGGLVVVGVSAVDSSTPPARACAVGTPACFGDGR